MIHLRTQILLHPIQFFEFETLVELQQKATVANTTNPMFGTVVDKAYHWTTYSEFDVEVAKARIAYSQLHVRKDDKVALISNNRIEWAITQYAVAGLGGQIIPM